MSHFFLREGGTKWWSKTMEGLLSTGSTPSSFNKLVKLSESVFLCAYLQHDIKINIFFCQMAIIVGL